MADPARPLPGLSVVVPNYNHARYLESALRAHLSQSVPPSEILVVDDASTDDSCALVDRLASHHPSLRLIRLPRNGGVNVACNHGLREARGEYVCFSAADDIVGRDFAARSLELLARHPTAAFCFSDPAEMVGDTGVVQRLPLHLMDRPGLLSPDDIERLFRGSWFSFPGHTVVYRRHALLALGGFANSLRWYADWFANCVLAFRYGACYLPEVLAVFRVSPGSYYGSGVRETRVQRRLVYEIVDRLDADELRDVARAFRSSALMPDQRFRVLLWLLVSPRHRRYLTPRLVARLLVRGVWWTLKPYMPGAVRPAVRRLARRWAHLRTVKKTR